MMRTALIGAVVCAVLTAPQLAQAQAQPDNTVYACVNQGSNFARIVSVGTVPPTGACTPGEVLVQWAIAGPAGADGASVTVTGLFTGSGGGCANGGVSVLDGTSNTTYYLCNGADGAKGDKGDQGEPGPAAPLVAPPCFSEDTRYVDCGNGTVTDTVTGLVWLQQPGCFGIASYVYANALAAALQHGECGLTDGSSPGDWRLPTWAEWDATMAAAVALGCRNPSLTNDDGDVCLSVEGDSSFGQVTSTLFWSSSSAPTKRREAGVAYLINGTTFGWPKISAVGVWPVRGGTR